MRLRKVNTRKGRRKRLHYKRQCFFDKYKIDYIDYKNTIILDFFLTNRKKILPKRITHTCAKSHRKLTKAIKLARLMGLISFRNVLQTK